MDLLSITQLSISVSTVLEKALKDENMIFMPTVDFRCNEINIIWFCLVDLLPGMH